MAHTNPEQVLIPVSDGLAAGLGCRGPVLALPEAAEPAVEGAPVSDLILYNSFHLALKYLLIVQYTHVQPGTFVRGTGITGIILSSLAWVVFLRGWSDRVSPFSTQAEAVSGFVSLGHVSRSIKCHIYLYYLFQLGLWTLESRSERFSHSREGLGWPVTDVWLSL